VWREPSGGQANLARLLACVDVRPVDQRLGRDAGVLLGTAGADDPVEATLVAVAASGDRIMTSGPDDSRRLIACPGRSTVVVPC